MKKIGQTPLKACSGPSSYKQAVNTQRLHTHFTQMSMQRYVYVGWFKNRNNTLIINATNDNHSRHYITVPFKLTLLDQTGLLKQIFFNGSPMQKHKKSRAKDNRKHVIVIKTSMKAMGSWWAWPRRINNTVNGLCRFLINKSMQRTDTRYAKLYHTAGWTRYATSTNSHIESNLRARYFMQAKRKCPYPA